MLFSIVAQAHHIPNTNKTWQSSQPILSPRDHFCSGHTLWLGTNLSACRFSGPVACTLTLNVEPAAVCQISKGFRRAQWVFAKQFEGVVLRHRQDLRNRTKHQRQPRPAWHRVQMFWRYSSAVILAKGSPGRFLPDDVGDVDVDMTKTNGGVGPEFLVGRRRSLSIQNVLPVVVLYWSVCLMCVHYKAQWLHAIWIKNKGRICFQTDSIGEKTLSDY